MQLSLIDGVIAQPMGGWQGVDAECVCTDDVDWLEPYNKP
jgi:hypothetical protein